MYTPDKTQLETVLSQLVNFLIRYEHYDQSFSCGACHNSAWKFRDIIHEISCPIVKAIEIIDQIREEKNNSDGN